MQKRNGYREGKRGVQVWLPLALYGQMRGSAEADGVSLQQWLEEAVRVKAGSHPGERQPKPLMEVFAEEQQKPDWQAILAAGAASKQPDPVPVVEADPWLEIA